MSAPEQHDESDNEVEFASTDSGASRTVPMQCSSLRKNGFVLMKGRPVKIVEMSTSKTGKHSTAIVNMIGIDIFTGKKYEDMSPSTANMEVPVVIKKEYLLMDVTDDGFTALLDEERNENREDIKLPEGDLGHIFFKIIQKKL